MAYSTGTATGQLDLLGDIASFLATAGWTVDYNSTAPDNASDTQLMFHNADCYYTIVSRVTAAGDYGMKVNAHTSIDTGEPVNNQPGQCDPVGDTVGAWSIPISGSITYFFFGNSSFIYLIAKMGNWYQHLFMGQISALGAFSHRSYIGICWRWGDWGATTEYDYTGDYNYRCSPFGWSTGSVSNGYFLKHDGTWVTAAPGGPTYATMTTSMMGRYLSTEIEIFKVSWYDLYPCQFAWTPIMLPIFVAAPHPSISERTCIAGYFDGVYATRMDDIPAEHEFTVDTDDYICFPLISKVETFSSDTEAINYGIAVCKDV